MFGAEGTLWDDRMYIFKLTVAHSQKERQDEKAEGFVPDEGTR